MRYANTLSLQVANNGFGCQPTNGTRFLLDAFWLCRTGRPSHPRGIIAIFKLLKRLRPRRLARRVPISFERRRAENDAANDAEHFRRRKIWKRLVQEEESQHPD